MARSARGGCWMEGGDMTKAYDLERLRVACQDAYTSATALAQHDLPDWLAHRVQHLRGELNGFLAATDNTQED